MGKYNDLSLGRIEAIVNKLGGLEGVDNFLSSKIVLRLKIWKTIRLGGSEKENFYRTNGWANEIMASPDFKISATEQYLSLVKVTPSDLGCTNSFPNLEEIYKRAFALGLKICPAEVALALRNQYRDQPKGEWLHIAMKTFECDSTDEVPVKIESALALHNNRQSGELELVAERLDYNDIFSLKGAYFTFCIRN